MNEPCRDCQVYGCPDDPPNPALNRLRQHCDCHGRLKKPQIGVFHDDSCSAYLEPGGTCGECGFESIPAIPTRTSFQELWSTVQQELRDLREKLLLAAQEASQHQLDLERRAEEVKFWQRSCEAMGRDMQKVLLRLQKLGEVPIP